MSDNTAAILDDNPEIVELFAKAIDGLPKGSVAANFFCTLADGVDSLLPDDKYDKRFDFGGKFWTQEYRQRTAIAAIEFFERHYRAPDETNPNAIPQLKAKTPSDLRGELSRAERRIFDEVIYSTDEDNAHKTFTRRNFMLFGGPLALAAAHLIHSAADDYRDTQNHEKDAITNAEPPRPGASQKLIDFKRQQQEALRKKLAAERTEDAVLVATGSAGFLGWLSLAVKDKVDRFDYGKSEEAEKTIASMLGELDEFMDAAGKEVAQHRKTETARA